VVKAHGVRGDAVIELHTDEPKRRFAVGSSVAVEGTKRRLTVRTSRHQAGRLVVGFDGLTTREAAEALVGAVLVAEVPDDERPTGDDEYYDRQLVGLTVQLGDGRIVGQVADVMHGPAQDILVISTDAGERLVPFVDALVPSVDVAAGRITVADLPGLLDDADDTEVS